MSACECVEKVIEWGCVCVRSLHYVDVCDTFNCVSPHTISVSPHTISVSPHTITITITITIPSLRHRHLLDLSHLIAAVDRGRDETFIRAGPPHSSHSLTHSSHSLTHSSHSHTLLALTHTPRTHSLTTPRTHTPLLALTHHSSHSLTLLALTHTPRTHSLTTPRTHTPLLALTHHSSHSLTLLALTHHSSHSHTTPRTHSPLTHTHSSHLQPSSLSTPSLALASSSVLSDRHPTLFNNNFLGTFSDIRLKLMRCVSTINVVTRTLHA